MPDMRRRPPEWPPSLTHIQRRPGLADEVLRELAPLLAEEGIDVDDIDASDIDTLQAAMNRAVERRNMQLFTPVGPARDVASATLRRVVKAVIDGDTASAGALLDQIQPDSPDDTQTTVASCIGMALGLLDDWLPGHAPNAPTDLGDHTVLPAGHFTGARAATDVLVLARKARAFRSLDTLIIRQGSPRLLAGSVLALAAVINAWSELTHTPPADLADTLIR